MGRPPAKKKNSTPSSSNTILNFFSKSPADTPVRRRSDVKVEPGLDTVFRRTSSASRKGKEKAILSGGNEADPVIISDDEIQEMEPVFSGSTEVKQSPPPRPLAVPTEPSAPDSPSSPHAGPSQHRPRSCSPPPPTDGISPEPPPFPAVPDFRPPSTWPKIINTCGPSGHDGEDGDDDDEMRGGGGDGDDSVAGRDDDHVLDSDEDDDAGDGGAREPLETNLEDLEEAEEIVPLDQPPGPRQTSPTGSIGLNLNGLNLDMEWGEDAEEGMGMEDFGAEEGFQDVDDLPEEPVIGKRKTKGGAAQVRGSARSTSGKPDKCPICGTSLKGKVNTVSFGGVPRYFPAEAGVDADLQVVQKHINTCLDTSTNGNSSSKTNGKAKSRPISSFNAFSPAPSSRSPSPPLVEDTKGTNAFSVLMSGHKEREQWKDAEIDLKRDGKRIFGRRNAPFYKVLTGMPVAVDAFRYGAIPKVTAYLLS